MARVCAGRKVFGRYIILCDSVLMGVRCAQCAKFSVVSFIRRASVLMGARCTQVRYIYTANLQLFFFFANRVPALVKLALVGLVVK